MSTNNTFSLVGDIHQGYDTLKMNVLMATGSMNALPKTLVFTSCQEGEGVSTIASNFAIHAASDGNIRVMLMDMNFVSPAAHKIFKIPTEHNVHDMLVTKDAYHLSIPASPSYPLWVLPARNGTFNVQELNQLPNIEQLFTRCQNEFDLIVIDAPPLVTNGNITQSLAAYIDGVILVIETDNTRREVVKRMKERVENAGIDILGVVMNKRKFFVPRWLYKTL